jgi:alcohol dehydrogenase class IV
MQFEFATATQILFGTGRSRQVGELAAKLGKRTLVVTGRRLDRTRQLLDDLAEQGLAVDTFQVAHEPTIDTVTDGVRHAREIGADLVIGFGGGSVVDTGKAIAALLTNDGEPLDYLEVIGRGKPITQPAACYVAIPTTAGTGAEVTRNAVLGSPEHRVKVSLRSPMMLPRLAVVDPLLTYDLPPDITAATGLDALTQLIEPFVSHKSNPVTDAFCREGMWRAARSLRRVCQNGQDEKGREDMSLASLLGGLALANAKLGAVHGIAGPLGGMIPAPHGATCAALLPHVMAKNVARLNSQHADNPARARYDEVARIVTGEASATAADGVAWVQNLCRELQIPPLNSYGLADSDFPALIEAAALASSMQGNPVQLSHDDLTEILSRAL